MSFGKKPVESIPASNAGFGASPTLLPNSGTVQSATLSSSVASATAATTMESAGLLRYRDNKQETRAYLEAKRLTIAELLDQLDFQALEQYSPAQKRDRVDEACDKILPNIPVPLTASQIKLLKLQAMDDILGYGPIEVLLKDQDVNDIMINTARQIYVEKKGKVYLTDVDFDSEKHLIGVIQRIVSRVGRRIDEANPMVDARMPDGSRFNAIIPPLALDGALVSIRKFKKNKMPLRAYLDYGSMSEAMVRFLEIAGAIRLNIVISGGTGSGKTTLLNALSGHIDQDERVITIEDAAELQLHQPHVLRLETRPASTEGKGEVNQRVLVKNALRMRPDRIILGEMRGDEVIDVLSAMNTGHDGSMATIHSNSPRDCLSRVENLVAMSGVAVPTASLRYQIASAINIIVQVQRMRDGGRRITHIEEILGFDGTDITTQTLFSYRVNGVRPDGLLDGEFITHPVKTELLARAEYFGLAQELLHCLNQA